jgi:hypothetical protein
MTESLRPIGVRGERFRRTQPKSGGKWVAEPVQGDHMLLGGSCASSAVRQARIQTHAGAALMLSISIRRRPK